MSAALRTQPAALAAATAAGALTVAAFAPLGLWPVPFFTLAGLLFLWQRAAVPAQAFWRGFAFGAGLFGAGVSWVYVSLHDFGTMPAPLAALATFLFCVILSLYPAAVGWCVARVRPAGAAAVLAFAALWTLSEWLRGWIFTGFPWLAVGYSQSDSPLAGFAPVAGVFGVSFATTLCAAMLRLGFGSAGRVRAVTVAALALTLGTGLLLRQVSWTSPQGPPVRVALLQGDVPQDLKFDPERYAETLSTYKRLIEGSRAQLIVLPETAIPRFLDAVDPAYLRDLARIARDKGADLLIGAPLRDSEGRYFNSVVSIGESPTQRYDKSHLVPFGEFVPAGFGWIVRTVAIPLSDFSPGPEHPQPLALAGQLVAPNICYEDAFGQEIVRQLPRATLLVNVSNVAWFGDSLAPAQHLQISRMRAIETGRYMLRATNTGVTAVIDPRGRLEASAPEFAPAVLNRTVHGHGGATPFVTLGNYGALALCAALIVIGARGRAQGKR